MVLFLSVLLLLILGYTIYSLTRHDQLYQEAAELAASVPMQELQVEERSLARVVWVFFTGGVLLTGTFAVQFFSGSDDPTHWTVSQWIYASIGCVMTLAITLGQKHLYSRIHTTKAGLLITFLILVFVIFSEIATSSERTDLLVKHRSESSQVYQNVVGAINNPAPSVAVNTSGLAQAQAAKAKAQVEIDACERHRHRGQRRVDECLRIERGNLAAAEARIQAIQSQSIIASEQALKQKLALVDKAKELQYDENQNPAIIRFLKTLFGGAILHSMILASLIAVVAFEAGFHFTGTRRAVVKHALLLQANHKKPLPTQQEDAAPVDAVSPSPTKASTQNAGTAAKAQQQWQAGLQQFGIDSPADPALATYADQEKIQALLQHNQALPQSSLVDTKPPIGFKRYDSHPPESRLFDPTKKDVVGRQENQQDWLGADEAIQCVPTLKTPLKVPEQPSGATTANPVPDTSGSVSVHPDKECARTLTHTSEEEVKQRDQTQANNLYTQWLGAVRNDEMVETAKGKIARVRTKRGSRTWVQQHICSNQEGKDSNHPKHVSKVVDSFFSLAERAHIFRKRANYKQGQRDLYEYVGEEVQI